MIKTAGVGHLSVGETKKCRSLKWFDDLHGGGPLLPGQAVKHVSRRHVGNEIIRPGIAESCPIGCAQAGILLQHPSRIWP
jgi:hypothetical protein